jgi:hypothetical protein
MNEDASFVYKAPLSDRQYFVLWGIGSVACALSWFGSLSIIYIARRKLTSIYHRLLFIISWVDLVANLMGFLNPIMMNEDTGYPLAHGNRSTCTTVGFFTLFGMSSKAFYSCYISVYFMLAVRYSSKDEQLYRYEKLAYTVSIILPISYCIVGLFHEAFNPNEFRFCALAKYPIGCEGDECIYGKFARK